MATDSTYTWTGTDRKGRKTQGEVSATSKALAQAQLRKQGVTTKTLKKKAKPLFSSGGKKINPADVAIFTLQLATMMRAGEPLVQSFDIVSEGLDNANMKNLVVEIKNEVSAGGGLANSLSKHPKYFDELFLQLGGLGRRLGHARNHARSHCHLQRKDRGAQGQN